MRIAITGGIGTGKTFVCRLLAKRSINVYDCDAAAKRLMRDSSDIQAALRSLIGNNVYHNDVLQKSIVARFLLADERNNEAINDIVHPAVAADFLSSGYEWLESAILFESGFNQRVPFDSIICVAAPTDVRMKRIMERDNISAEQALAWIDRQLDSEEVARRSDFVIVNDGHSNLDKQIDNILNKLNNIS